MNIFEKRYRQVKEQGRSSWFEDGHYDTLVRFWKDWLSSLHNPAGPVLEIGCGVGVVAEALVEMGYEVTGIDVSESAIEQAGQRLDSADFHVVDVKNGLPYEAGSFGIVIDSDCLHHIEGLGREIFLSEAFRVLRPGGFLLVKTNIGQPTPENWDRFGFDAEAKVTRQGTEVMNYFADEEEVIREVESAGFDIHTCWSKSGGEGASDQLMVAAVKPRSD